MRRIVLTGLGPGEKKLAPPDADWIFRAGDLSALPAVSVNLETLPADMRGFALIEVPSLEDVQDVAAPAGVEVRWLVNSDESRPNAALVEALAAVEWLDGIDRREMYLSSYWKRDDTDEAMKRAKALDAKADAAVLAP